MTGPRLGVYLLVHSVTCAACFFICRNICVEGKSIILLKIFFFNLFHQFVLLLSFSTACSHRALFMFSTQQV